MIPAPIDPALLREHAFAETGNLAIVLSKEKFSDEGGYKSVTKYGLGYFNYMVAAKKCVRGISYKEILRGHFYHYFNWYFITLSILFGIWVLLLLIRDGRLARILNVLNSRLNLKKKKKDDMSYDYVPV